MTLDSGPFAFLVGDDLVSRQLGQGQAKGRLMTVGRGKTHAHFEASSAEDPAQRLDRWRALPGFVR